MTYTSPMVLESTKVCVINILKSISLLLETLENSQENFENVFSTYLEENVLNYLTEVNQGDLLNIRRILQQIYKPILNT